MDTRRGIYEGKLRKLKKEEKRANNTIKLPQWLQVTLTDYDIECIQKAKQIIDADLGNHFTIVNISVKVHIGKTKLKQGFREYFGMGLFTYLKIQRMHKAAELLAETKRTIKQISRDTGFKYTTNFNKAFASFHGITPANYRHLFKIQSQ